MSNIAVIRLLVIFVVILTNYNHFLNKNEIKVINYKTWQNEVTLSFSREIETYKSPLSKSFRNGINNIYHHEICN
jgi:hypothetical protein